ncbi:hypothetical protein [Pseudomonas sp. NPDC007930]|uniref:hypothetical protein n=1 Tax=Pseudomonas sp. NPDC007930 TaxID=3364417 RepID=UPI0036E48156
MTTIYNQNRYMEKTINCNHKRESLERILEPLYVMTYTTSKDFNRPIGLHLRVRFTEKMNLSKFSACINRRYDKHGYTPARVSVKEIDDDEGTHYHIAMIIDGKYNTPLNLQQLCSKMKSNGFLANYKVINHKDHPYGLVISSEATRDIFFDWVSYLAKKISKTEGKQCFSKCKAVQRDTSSWISNGKPNLSMPKDKPAEVTPSNTLWAFIS